MERIFSEESQVLIRSCRCELHYYRDLFCEIIEVQTSSSFQSPEYASICGSGDGMVRKRTYRT